MLVKRMKANTVIIFFMHFTIFYSCEASPALRAHRTHKVRPTLEVTEQRRLSNSALSGMAMLAGSAESALGVAPRLGMSDYHSNEWMSRNSKQKTERITPLSAILNIRVKLQACDRTKKDRKSTLLNS